MVPDPWSVGLWVLTFNVSEGTEGPPGAAAALLHVVTPGGFIDLWGGGGQVCQGGHVTWALSGDTPTSGWNCCSVLVWQYWQPSAPSHLLGSPHSSLCFTDGHGSALHTHTRR